MESGTNKQTIGLLLGLRGYADTAQLVAHHLQPKRLAEVMRDELRLETSPHRFVRVGGSRDDIREWRNPARLL